MTCHLLQTPLRSIYRFHLLRDLFALGTHCDPTLLTSACLDHICRGAACTAWTKQERMSLCMHVSDRDQAWWRCAGKHIARTSSRRRAATQFREANLKSHVCAGRAGSCAQVLNSVHMNCTMTHEWIIGLCIWWVSQLQRSLSRGWRGFVSFVWLCNAFCNSM